MAGVLEQAGGRGDRVSGLSGGDQPNVEHARFAVEVKSGRVMSARMLAAVDQAVAVAEASGKIPMVAIEQSAGRGPHASVSSCSGLRTG